MRRGQERSRCRDQRFQSPAQLQPEPQPPEPPLPQQEQQPPLLAQLLQAALPQLEYAQQRSPVRAFPQAVQLPPADEPPPRPRGACWQSPEPQPVCVPVDGDIETCCGP